MCKPKNIYNFLAYAKACSCDLTCKYVSKLNYGHDVSGLMDKILLLRSYIREIERYVYPCCKDYYLDGVKHLNGKEVVMSNNNSLSLDSEGQKIQIESSELNCLTEDQICDLASRIKRICLNC